MEIDDVSNGDMNNSIQEYCENNSCYYVEIPDISIKKIYNYIIKSIYEKPTTDLEYMYYGVYHQIKLEYDLMIKYYMKAAKMGNIYAVHRLGKYYINSGNIATGKYYTKKAIKKGCLYAMITMALYYEREGNHDEGIKYYTMACTNSHLCDCVNIFRKNNRSCAHVIAASQLGTIYKTLRDYENMKKYYEIAINAGYSHAMRYYGEYFSSINDYENMEKYYLMAHEHGDVVSFDILYEFYVDMNMRKRSLFLLIKYERYDLYKETHYTINDFILDDETTSILMDKPPHVLMPNILKYLYKIIKTQMDPIQLHFEYTENGKGYDDAKKHFISMIGDDK